MIFPKPFIQLGRWLIYTHETPDEKEEKRQIALEAKYRAAILKEQRREVKYLARQIPIWLANMGHAYWYKKSEKEPMMGRFNPIKINRIEIGEDAYFFRVDTKRLPRGVLVAHLKAPEVVETLSHACDSQVRVSEGATGFWYAVETQYGRGNIPALVGYAEMLKLMPPDAPPLAFPLGMGENQRPHFHNLDKVYTLLIGGSKGTGKSNEANVIICTLISRNSPKKLRLFLTDLKGGIEFYGYNGVPHLGGDVFWINEDAETETRAERRSKKIIVRVAPPDYKPKANERLEPPMGQKILTDPIEVLPVLAYCEAEMDRRFRLLAPTGAKNILSYNKKYPNKELSHWLIIIDELATMMEDPRYKAQAKLSLNELARKGRACGIYLILATQTPTSDIVPAQIGNNMDARLAFRCGSGPSSGILLGDGQYDAVRLPPIEGRFVWKWGTERFEVQAPYMAESALAAIIADVRAGKFVDAKEAELAQKADFVFKFALQMLRGECQSNRLWAMVKDQGIKKSQLASILETYQVKNDGKPEILLDGEIYVLAPPIQAKRIARWLVPVADYQARRHPHPDYNYDLVSRSPFPENPSAQVLADLQNLAGSEGNSEIANLADLPFEPLINSEIAHRANGAGEQGSNGAGENETIWDTDGRISEPVRANGGPNEDDDLPDWLRDDEEQAA
jgi:hypothetical protein